MLPVYLQVSRIPKSNYWTRWLADTFANGHVHYSLRIGAVHIHWFQRLDSSGRVNPSLIKPILAAARPFMFGTHVSAIFTRFTKVLQSDQC